MTQRRLSHSLAVGLLPAVFLTVMLLAPVFRLLLEGGAGAVAGMASAIWHDDYLRWLGVAPENLGRIEAAVRDGDADGAFAAFRDPENGLHLLVQGCQGCQGW